MKGEFSSSLGKGGKKGEILLLERGKSNWESNQPSLYIEREGGKEKRPLTSFMYEENRGGGAQRGRHLKKSQGILGKNLLPSKGRFRRTD